MLMRPSKSLGCKETDRTELALGLASRRISPQERIVVHHRGPSFPQWLWNRSSVILLDTNAWMFLFLKVLGKEG